MQESPTAVGILSELTDGPGQASYNGSFFALLCFTFILAGNVPGLAETLPLPVNLCPLLSLQAQCFQETKGISPQSISQLS